MPTDPGYSHVDVNIRVSEQDLAAVNLTSIPLTDGDYVAQLGVYHELHCIVRGSLLTGMISAECL